MPIRVRAASRLHFGLLNLGSADRSGTLEGLPIIRQFGGTGLMVQEPGLEVVVDRADSWSAHGPLSERALGFAKHFARALPHTQADVPPLGPYAIEVGRAAPEHRGLGTGTQLALAVARAITVVDQLNLDVGTLAALVGRGARSGLGVHGFAQGGLLVDGGKGPATTIAPVIARWDFPMAWRVVLILPEGQGLHGLAESEVFTAGRASDVPATDTLCRIVLLGLLPALREGDLDAFGEALFEFNRRAGELFLRWQGGVYGHPQSGAIVDFIRQKGVRGVGQSSWGPSLFAVTDIDRANALARQLCEHFQFAPHQVLVTKAANHGAQVEFLRTM